MEAKENVEMAAVLLKIVHEIVKLSLHTFNHLVKIVLWT